MRTIYHDEKLRSALHSIYIAQFLAIRACPVAFTKAEAARMLTGLMGSRRWSWRVIGITPAALKVFADHDFKYPLGQLQRGHEYDRASTAQLLYFDRSDPMPLTEFFDTFLKRDATVIMTKSENKHKRACAFLDYIHIDPHEEVFPCNPLVGWQHGKAEVAFLRALHATHMHSSVRHGREKNVSGLRDVGRTEWARRSETGISAASMQPLHNPV